MSRKGFTLIEIMVAIVILSILVGVSANAYTSYIRNSRDARRIVDLESIRSALELHRSNSTNGNYPEILDRLVETHYFDAVPVDPLNDADLGHVYQYLPYPVGCQDSGVPSYCTNYDLNVVLENGTDYTIGPTTPGGLSNPPSPTPTSGVES